MMKNNISSDLKNRIMSILENNKGKLSTNAIKEGLYPEYRNYDKILNALLEMEDNSLLNVDEVEKEDKTFRKWSKA